MQIEINKVYRTGRHGIAWIAGNVPEHPEWVWSTQGNWYEQSTGRYVAYGKEESGAWVHYVAPFASGLDIVEKVSDDWRA